MNKLWAQEKAKASTAVFLKVEDEILYNAAKMLGKNKSLLTKEDYKSWESLKLNQLGQLNEENLKLLTKYARLEYEEVEKMLREAGYTAVDRIEGDLQKGQEAGLLLNPPSVEDSESLVNALKAQEREARKKINQVNNTMLRQTGNKYRQVVNEVSGQIVAGVQTPQEALRSAVASWAESGIPALIDKAGRQWSTEAYVNMVTRTFVNNVANDMQDARMEEYGNDLVEISSHAGARPGCEPWQGAIYSLSGKNKNYTAFRDTSHGEAAGLLGINCGHFKYPYIAGISEQTYYPYDKEENDRIYKESQQQRYHERQIRSAKNEKRMMEGLGDREGVDVAQAKIKSRQATMREFIGETKRTRRYEREQLV